MITVTIKGRISNVRFLENEGAIKVRGGQYFAYEMLVADEAAAVALQKRIEGDGYAWEGYEKCWCEWTSAELDAEIAAELAEDHHEPLYAGWASIAQKLHTPTNEDCYLVVLDQLGELEQKMYRKRADVRRVRAIMRELESKTGAAAAAHYATVRDEIRAFAQKYW